MDSEIKSLTDAQEKLVETQEQIKNSGKYMPRAFGPYREINQLPGYDCRCASDMGNFKILNYNGRDIYTSAEYEWSFENYPDADADLIYLQGRSAAIAYGGWYLDYIKLINFDSCTTEDIPPNFEYNTYLFLLTFRSISPDENYIIYEIYYGSHTNAFPGTERSYTEADIQKNGYWLYNLKNQNNYQLKHLPIETDTDLDEFEWGENQLIIKIVGCPVSGCLYNL